MYKLLYIYYCEMRMEWKWKNAIWHKTIHNYTDKTEMEGDVNDAKNIVC